MKKIIFVYALILVFLTLSFVSCSKENNIPEPEIREVKFDIKVNCGADNALNTKALKTDWVVGDKVYVFFNVTAPNSGYSAGYLQDYQYLTLTFNGSSWDGAFGGTNMKVDRIGTAGYMYAIYFPFGNVKTYANSDGNFYGSGNTNPALNNPVYSYYLTDVTGSSYTLTKNQVATLSGTLNMTIPDGFVYFYIEGADGKYNQNEKYRLSVEGVKPVGAKIWGRTSNDFTKQEMGVGQPLWGYKYGTGIAFSGVIDDTWASANDHKMIFFSDGDPAVTKTFSGKTLASHSSVKLKAPTAANGWTQAVSAPTYTLMCDGLKWADWNLGSTSLNDDNYAYLFRWGELVPNGNGSYKNIFSSNSLTGNYAIFDAARAFLGSNWRMVTSAERDNIKTLTTPSKQSSGDVTAGHFTKSGLVLTGNSDPTNSILLRSGSDGYGYYWTSTADGGGQAHSFWTSEAIMNATALRDKFKAIRPIYIGE